MSGDRRMHEGNTPGLDSSRGHERHEQPYTPAADAIGKEQDLEARIAHGGHGPAGVDRTDAEPGESTLGGHVATRSGTAETSKSGPKAD